jgi:hypothetical protein
MPNNRSFLSDLDIVRPAQLLDKGIPLPFLSGKFVVDEGWCAVITEGGAYKEILEPGTHFLEKYHWRRDVKATLVDKRLKTLTVSTTREFTIAQPVPVEINLDLAIEYQITDPRRVATEISNPLTSLYDRVIQAVRGVVVYATIDEIRTQGEGLARATLQRLQGMQLPKILGIEVFNVLVTLIKATDAGSDALAQQQMKEYTTVRDWQMDSMITQQSRVTPEWLMMHRPEIYQQLIAGNQEILKEMIDKGLLDPAGFLNQSTGASPIDPTKLLGGFGFPGFGNNSPMSGTSAPGMVQPQLPGQTSAPQSSSNDINLRMREEIGYLLKLPGAQVENKPGTDQFGVPDGSYDIKVDLPRSSGGHITLFITCPSGYPQRPPSVDVDLDEQATPFESPTLRRWTGQYLVEVVREAKQLFG